MLVKKCTKCGVEKPRVEFSKRRASHDGLAYNCKNCVKAYKQEHKDELAIKRKVYDLAHKEEKVAYRKVYSLEHKEEEAAYRLTHKEDRVAYHRDYRLGHKEEAATYYLEHKAEIAAYRLEHKEEANARRRERRRIDPNYIFAEFCRDQVKRMLKGNSKDCRSEEYLGCTKEQGKKYIESLWEPGMTWENRGEWEIHHLESLASFNPNDPTAIFWACHISNLKPLWVEEHKRVHHG